MNETFTVYLAPHGFLQELTDEINTNIICSKGHLILVKGSPKKFAWAQNTWLNPRFIPINSITDGAKKLLSIQRNWWLHSENHHRRATLIQQQLPYVSAKKLHFGEMPPQAPLGSWTLWEKDIILASPDCSSVFPDGVITFHENKVEPPSRAYLKLWEVFTRFSFVPSYKDLCIDLGASPGGWTWVLAKLGSNVISIDKAPLASHISSLPNVEHYTGSGFGFTPLHIGNVDWIFSDMACYPDKLYHFIQPWIINKKCHTIICTLKLQGKPNNSTLSCFKKIKSSYLTHLSYNKHELTWIYSTKYPLVML